MNVPRKGIRSIEKCWLAVPSRTMIHTPCHNLCESFTAGNAQCNTELLCHRSRNDHTPETNDGSDLKKLPTCIFSVNVCVCNPLWFMRTWIYQVGLVSKNWLTHHMQGAVTEFVGSLWCCIGRRPDGYLQSCCDHKLLIRGCFRYPGFAGFQSDWTGVWT